MLETALVATATFFATIGPLDVAALFAALTPQNSTKERLAIALKGTLIALSILLVFAVFGDSLLHLFGISLPALRTAGGVLLLLIAIDMVFARDSGGVTTPEDEKREATPKADFSVFPLATPLIAGPGTMGATILLVANAEGDPATIGIVIGALVAMLAATFVLMLIAAQIQRLLGVTGLHVIARVMGVLLAALAVQFIFDGIAGSGLVGG